MADRHPAVAFLDAVHYYSVALAHQNLRQPQDQAPPPPPSPVATRAARAAGMHYPATHPSSVLRRVASERALLAEHSPGDGPSGRGVAWCRVCSGAAPGCSGSVPVAYPCGVWIGLARAWGWVAEA